MKNSNSTVVVHYFANQLDSPQYQFSVNIHVAVYHYTVSFHESENKAHRRAYPRSFLGYFMITAAHRLAVEFSGSSSVSLLLLNLATHHPQLDIRAYIKVYRDTLRYTEIYCDILRYRG